MGMPAGMFPAEEPSFPQLKGECSKDVLRSKRARF
jgi:hypothetical protein